ncbi:hypothetical protein ISP15_12830 [Dyella jejuensis]|uniref:Uncharacterized protein n=1 Tax=Dyella jejuensis TaxID=1432009 RepID=A0ABW8JLR3_9GAMM
MKKASSTTEVVFTAAAFIALLGLMIWHAYAMKQVHPGFWTGAFALTVTCLVLAFIGRLGVGLLRQLGKRAALRSILIIMIVLLVPGILSTHLVNRWAILIAACVFAFSYPLALWYQRAERPGENARHNDGA